MDTKMRDEYFKYSLPTTTAHEYARSAIAVLTAIRRDFPQFSEQFFSPSEVLTLSGVRAFDTYYEFGRDASLDSINDLSALLRRHHVHLVDETFAFAGIDNPEKRYSIVHLDAIKELPKRYGYIPEWQAFDVQKIVNPNEFLLWWHFWKTNICFMEPERTPLPKRWITEWWAVHTMTFGMLLGYPGEAICSSIYTDMLFNDHGTETPSLRARIEPGLSREGAQPVYDFAVSQKDNPHITGHEKLWSEILNEVYAAFAHE